MTKDFSGELMRVAPAIPSFEPPLSGACAETMPVARMRTRTRNTVAGQKLDLHPDDINNDQLLIIWVFGSGQPLPVIIVRNKSRGFPRNLFIATTPIRYRRIKAWKIRISRGQWIPDTSGLP
jgi:hypothetical protein